MYCEFGSVQLSRTRGKWTASRTETPYVQANKYEMGTTFNQIIKPNTTYFYSTTGRLLQPPTPACSDQSNYQKIIRNF